MRAWVKRAGGQSEPLAPVPVAVSEGGERCIVEAGKRCYCECLLPKRSLQQPGAPFLCSERGTGQADEQ